MAKKKTYVWNNGSRHSTPDPALYSVDKQGIVHYGDMGTKIANLLKANGSTPVTQIGDGQPLHPKPKPTDDPYYNQDLIDLGTERTVGLGQVDLDMKTAGNRYGFTPSYDPAGNPTGNYGVDPSDPFSKMAALQRNYETMKRSTMNSYGARGQVHSGAVDAAQASNTYNLNQGTDALMKDFTDILQGGIGSKRAIGGQFNAGSKQALDAWLNRRVAGGNV